MTVFVNDNGNTRMVSDESLDTAGAARFLFLKPQTLRLMRSTGRGPKFFRIGGPLGRARYRCSDIQAWVAERTFSNTAEESAKAAKEEAAALKGGE